MDTSFSADYSFGTSLPSSDSLNYFTTFKPIEANSGFSLGRTIAPEFGDWSVSSGQSTTAIESAYPSAKPTGNVFDGGLLNTITATANGFLDTVGKAYSIKNSFESQKLGQKIQQSELELQRAQVGAQLEIGKAQTAAMRDVEIARAGTAVADAQTQLRSSQGASVVNVPQAVPWVLIISGAAALFFFARRGKAA